GIPVAVDAHPKYATCLGAAIATGARLASLAPAGPGPSHPGPAVGAAPLTGGDADRAATAPATPPVTPGGGADRASARAAAPQPMAVDLAGTGIAEQIDTTKSTSAAPTRPPGPRGPERPAERAGGGDARRRMLLVAGAVVAALVTV